METNQDTTKYNCVILQLWKYFCYMFPDPHLITVLSQCMFYVYKMYKLYTFAAFYVLIGYVIDYRWWCLMYHVQYTCMSAPCTVSRLYP